MKIILTMLSAGQSRDIEKYMLYKVVNEANSLKNSVAAQFVTVTDLPTNSLKMATAVVATGPIVLLYPFVQRYFIGGITVGAVKG